jgi:glycosyltransferase involved in cell wall biosynthesis
MNNKICVYAICKNESQFVDKWYESMKEADEIIVLDTGSTDDTVEQLKKYSDIKVFQKTYIPWRFDTPRNDAMDYASDDVDIFISTDLDEILEPGWADILRKNWDPAIHTRAEYTYAWSHTESGDPARVFTYNKVHNREWRWSFPVHELLTRNGSCDYSYEEALHDTQGMYLHHYPDPSKSRSSYLSLLELRKEEHPDDDFYGKLYLTHEYYYQGLYQKCVDFIRGFMIPNIDKYDNLEQANIYLFLGDAYAALGEYDSAVGAWLQSIQINRGYRDPYLKLAEHYNNIGLYHVALGYVQEAEKSSIRYYNWLEQDTSWNVAPNDIKALAYYYLGKYKTAYGYGKVALQYAPSDSRLQANLEYYKAKLN